MGSYGKQFLNYFALRGLHMVKHFSKGDRRGLRDWLIQRVSAVFMLLYTIGLLGYCVFGDHLDYPSWHYLFSQAWMKIATLIAFASLLWHAWIGVWTVLTDYVKSAGIRLVSYVLVILSLVVYFFWCVVIVWGV